MVAYTTLQLAALEYAQPLIRSGTGERLITDLEAIDKPDPKIAVRFSQNGRPVIDTRLH